MFYQCLKCKRVWGYPVERCPECFLGLNRLKSENIKIIGISKVSIPTIFHPKIPYFVLVLEDGQGNRWVQKSAKEYKIGDSFKIEPCAEKNAVSIWRIKYDILEGIERVVDLLGGLPRRQNFGAGVKVLILPTLISPRHSYFTDNTSPEFLEGAIKYLLERGVGAESIKVAGQSFDEIPIEESVKKSGLLDVCLKNRVQLLDLAKGEFIKKTQDNLNFEISGEIFSADLIINLPVLKVGRVSASENLFKFLKKENYLGLKYLSSDKEIFQGLTKHLPPILTLAEAQGVQKTDQFVAFLGLVFASFNALNLDRVFAEVIMTRLTEALKDVKIEDIPIIGRAIEEIQYEIEKY